MQKAEINYWKSEFQKATNSKDFWRTVKKVQKKRVDKKIGPIEDDNGNVVTDDGMKAEFMNDLFCTIGDKLAKDTQENHRQEIRRQNIPFIQHVTAVPIIEQIRTDKHFLQSQLKSVKPEKATILDGIRPKDVKLAEDSIVDGLDLVIQKSKETQKCQVSGK